MLEEWRCENGRDENMEMKFGIYRIIKALRGEKKNREIWIFTNHLKIQT